MHINIDKNSIFYYHKDIMDNKKDQIYKFIKERSHLIWFTENYEELSEEAIVEAVLNYGSLDDFRSLVKILGIKKVAFLFEKGANQKRTNYKPEIKNYFSLYFKKYA